MVARTNKKNQGVTDFEAQAINTSGGTNPNTVSDIKKMVKIIFGEYVATKLFSIELISKTNNSSPTISNTNTITEIPPLMAVSFKNG